jgi:hypothetical protein
VAITESRGLSPHGHHTTKGYVNLTTLVASCSSSVHDYYIRRFMCLFVCDCARAKWPLHDPEAFQRIVFLITAAPIT